MSKRNLVWVLPVILAAGCSGDKQSATASCLMQAAQSPCDVLVADLVAPLVAEGVAVPEAKASDFAKIYQCKYSWDGGRTRKFETGSVSMDLPVPDEVRLTNIRQVADKSEQALAQFTNQYSTRSDEEKARMAEQAAERTKNEIDEKHQDMASDFASRLINSLAFEPVQGLGDAAAWGGAGKNKSLYVLSGTTSFELLVDRSSDPAQRKQDSMQLAQGVLDNCS